MKSAINGGLQLSVLDGWWAEGYEANNGWAIWGEIDHDHGAQDWRHAAELYRLVTDEISGVLRARRGRLAAGVAGEGARVAADVRAALLGDADAGRAIRLPGRTRAEALRKLRGAFKAIFRRS